MILMPAQTYTLKSLCHSLNKQIDIGHQALNFWLLANYLSNMLCISLDILDVLKDISMQHY